MAYVQGSMLLAKTTNDPEVFLRLAHGMVALAEADLPRAGPPEETNHDNLECGRQVGEVMS